MWWGGVVWGRVKLGMMRTAPPPPPLFMAGFSNNNHRGDVSSLLYATPPQQKWAEGPQRGGGGHWRGGSREGRWGGGGWEGRLGGVQVGRFGVVGWGAGGGASLLSILDPNTHSNPSLG